MTWKQLIQKLNECSDSQLERTAMIIGEHGQEIEITSLLFVDHDENLSDYIFIQ